MAWGWLGDHSTPPGQYNVTALRTAIAAYDALWEGYFALPARHPGYITNASLSETRRARREGDCEFTFLLAFDPTPTVTDLYWEHPNSGQPGMRASVNQYRNVTGRVY